MATNEILPFASTVAADNLISQADYLADVGGIRTVGNQPGIADDRLVNKAARQASIIAAAIAQIAADNQSTNIVDTLTVNQMRDALIAGINAATKQKMIVQQIEANGVGAGDTIAATVTVPLNTVVYNTIDGASLAASKITLPIGSYLITARQTLNGVQDAKAWLRNITAGNTVIGVGTGSDTVDLSSGGGGVVNGFSNIIAPLTLAVASEIDLRVTADAIKTNGLGRPCLVTTLSEVYATVEIEKVG